MNKEEFYEFLENRKQTVQAEIQTLSADGRTDEANILKAKYNVYDIGKAVFGATEKQAGDAVATAFPAAFTKISSSWQVSLDQAKAHDDNRKILIEEAKLSAVSEITAKFAAFI
ncbi:MAG: hypothetical protein J6Y20_02510 [Lachnospiraceae bacterium]|nr:hypothetical protein [Lachnospiraceae bacterium]